MTQPPAIDHPNQRLLWILVTFTPLRWMSVRDAGQRLAWAVARTRRRRLEARGDASLSRPALFTMDVRLGELLGRDGYFVEAGAYDGYTQSNTYYLERFLGWRGLLVEPAPKLAAEARRNRPDARVEQAALTSPERSGAGVRMRSAGLMSMVAGIEDRQGEGWIGRAYIRGERDIREFEAPGRTLSELLDQAGAPEVDVLSLDLEGFEPEALRGLDLGRHAPRWVLVEAHEPQHRAAIEEILGERYVHVERFSEMDELYRRADLAPRSRS